MNPRIFFILYNFFDDPVANTDLLQKVYTGYNPNFKFKKKY